MISTQKKINFFVNDSSKKQKDMRTQELEMVSHELTFPLTAVKLGRKPKYTTKTTLTRKKGKSFKTIKLKT